jgi:hypothetical protein
MCIEHSGHCPAPDHYQNARPISTLVFCRISVVCFPGGRTRTRRALYVTSTTSVTLLEGCEPLLVEAQQCFPQIKLAFEIKDLRDLCSRTTFISQIVLRQRWTI